MILKKVNFFTFVNKATFKVALFLLGFLFVGCANLQEMDRSFVNQPNAELKSNIHTTNSPMTGLRTLSAGGVSCSNCAH